jgi:hypothetical protein
MIRNRAWGGTLLARELLFLQGGFAVTGDGLLGSDFSQIISHAVSLAIHGQFVSRSFSLLSSLLFFFRFPFLPHLTWAHHRIRVARLPLCWQWVTQQHIPRLYPTHARYIVESLD